MSEALCLYVGGVLTFASLVGAIESKAKELEPREQDTKCNNKKCKRLAWARVTIPGAFVVRLCRPCTESLRNSLSKNLGDAA